MAAAKQSVELELNGDKYEEALNDCVKATKKEAEAADDAEKELKGLAKEGGKVQSVFQKLAKIFGMSDKDIIKYGKALNTAGKIMGGIGAVAGTAYAGFQAIDTIMNSNAGTARDWNTNIDACKDAVNEFYIALATGDFSRFENGLSRAIGLSYIFKNNIKEIENDLKIGDATLSVKEHETDKYEQQALDVRLTKEKREEANRNFQESFADTVTYVDKLFAATDKHINAALKAKGINLQGDKARKDALNYFSTFTNEGIALRQYRKAISDQANYEKIRNDALETGGASQKTLQGYDDKIAAAKNTKAYLEEAYPQIAEFNKLYERFGDGEQLEQLIGWIDALAALGSRKESLYAKEQGLSSHFDKDGKLIEPKVTTTGGTIVPTTTATKTNDKETAADGTIAKLRQEVDDLSRLVERTPVNSIAFLALSVLEKAKRKELEAAEAVKNKILNGDKTNGKTKDTDKNKIDISGLIAGAQTDFASNAKEILLGAIPQLSNEDMSAVFGGLNPMTFLENFDIDEINSFADNYIAALQSFLDRINELLKTDNISDSSKQMAQKLKDGIEKQISAVEDSKDEMNDAFDDKKAAKFAAMDNAVSSLQNLAQGIGSLAGASKEWQAISQGMMIAATIAGLIVQLQKCTNVWEYIAASAAGFASIAGSFASMQSFANGGIVDGPTSIGDYNLARVNDGEMVLNNSQQHRLFHMLNEGGAIRTDNAQIERVWTIKGSDLVGTIKNYNKLQSKTGRKIF